jgi:hypothetical protein
MSPRARRRIGTAAVSAACCFAVGSTVACSTVLGIGDWTNLTDGGEPDAQTGDGAESTAEGGPDATMPESGIESGTDATIEAGGNGPGNDGGLDAPEGEGGGEAGACTAPETKCVDGGVETCTSSGTYGAAVPCASATCAMGMCTGSCEAGATQCSGNSAQQTCVSGTWGTPVTCTNQACVGTACAGVCSPSATRCTSDTQVETCGSDGQWGAAMTCTDACVGTIGTVGGSCGGECVPGTARCCSAATGCSSTSIQILLNAGDEANPVYGETCGSDGMWLEGTTCGTCGFKSGIAQYGCNLCAGVPMCEVSLSPCEGLCCSSTCPADAAAE